MVPVMREGLNVFIDVSELVVGDIFEIQTGEIFSIDGIVLESNSKINSL
jgi:magnesium-transporting ATPase (P-type)